MFCKYKGNKFTLFKTWTEGVLNMIFWKFAKYLLNTVVTPCSSIQSILLRNVSFCQFFHFNWVYCLELILCINETITVYTLWVLSMFVTLTQFMSCFMSKQIHVTCFCCTAESCQKKNTQKESDKGSLERVVERWWLSLFCWQSPFMDNTKCFLINNSTK